MKALALWGLALGGIAVMAVVMVRGEGSPGAAAQAGSVAAHQRAFAALRRSGSPEPAAAASLGPKGDRCARCHLGSLSGGGFDDPSPHTSHSLGLLQTHDPARFGCTVCHRGDGSALDASRAHRGMLRGDLVQVSCGRCHTWYKLEGAPVLTRGRELLMKKRCTGCHVIKNLEISGARLAPTLTGLADKVWAGWLYEWLESPSDTLENAVMPRFPLEAKHVDALVGYLMTFREPDGGAKVERPEGDEDRGRTIFRQSFCSDCHPVEGKGADRAPDLGVIGDKVRGDWLYRFLLDPHRFQPGTLMPHYPFKAQEVADIVAHLFSEYSDNGEETAEEEIYDPRKSPFEDPAERIDTGRRLFKELRCGNCHQFPGGQEWQKVAPVLTDIGSRSLDEIDHGTGARFEALGDYFLEKIKAPRSRWQRAKMPLYELEESELEAIVVALLAQCSERQRGGIFAPPEASLPTFQPAGEFGELVHRFRCFSCHSMRGQGINLTCDLSYEGSRAQRRWLDEYLRVPDTIRAMLTVRMPIFRWSDEDRRELVRGLSALRRPGFSSEEDIRSRLSPERVARGEKLFWTRGCVACHIVKGKGGYVGPGLTVGHWVGSRLRASWIYHWLERPQALYPDVIEPVYGLSQDERLALTAYLESLTGEDQPQ